MSTVQTVFLSRWGFHPCDYSTYRKLKFLHLVYQKVLRLAHAWERWHRKEPHNRVMRRRIRNQHGQTIGYGPPVPLSEPRLCPIFAQKVYDRRFVDKKGQYHKEGFMDEKVVIDDLGMAAAYAAARRPAPDPAAVHPLRPTLAEIDALDESARAWLEQQDAN